MTFIPKIWGTLAKKSMETGLLAMEETMKYSVIGEVEEYQSLTNRHWQRKRKLEKSIANKMRYWLEDMKRIDSEVDRTIKIPRISNLKD